MPASPPLTRRLTSSAMPSRRLAAPKSTPILPQGHRLNGKASKRRSPTSELVTHWSSGSWIDSLKDLINRITELNDRKIGFKSLTEQIDTTTSGGKLIFHIFGALAEFERDIIRERTNAGLEAARSRGKGGRPRALRPAQIQLAQKLYADKNTSVSEICKMLGISRHTLQRYVKEEK
jgi:DNA invertase Pin-like site-specific DNA recombinase